MSDPVLVSNDNSALLQNLASNRQSDAFSYSIPQNYPSYSRSVIRVQPDQKGFSTTSRWRIPKAGLLKNMWIRWELAEMELHGDAVNTSHAKYVNYLGCMIPDSQGVQLISKNKVLATLHPHYMIGRIADAEEGKKQALEAVVLKDQIDSKENGNTVQSPAAVADMAGTIRVYTPLGDFLQTGDSIRNFLDTVFVEALEVKLTTRSVDDLFDNAATPSADDLIKSGTGTVATAEIVCEFIHPDPEYMSLKRNNDFGSGVMSVLSHTSQEEARVTKTPADDTEAERTITADIKTPNVMTRLYFCVIKDQADAAHKPSDENDFLPLERVEFKANGRVLYDYHADEIQFLANRGYGRSATLAASTFSEMGANQSLYCLNFSLDGQSRDYQSGAVSGRELNNCQLVCVLADNQETESVQSVKYTLVVNPEVLSVLQISADTGNVDRGLDV